MEYDDIIKISDLEKRNDEMIKHYTENVCVLDWITSDNKQVINFSNRVEYKVNGKYHRLDGPAIEFFKSDNCKYFINGVEMNKEKWKPIATNILREMKIKRIVK